MELVEVGQCSRTLRRRRNWDRSWRRQLDRSSPAQCRVCQQPRPCPRCPLKSHHKHCSMTDHINNLYYFRKGKERFHRPTFGRFKCSEIFKENLDGWIMKSKYFSKYFIHSNWPGCKDWVWGPGENKHDALQ